jgi:tRNA(Ile)-lysidine synthase
MLETVLMRVLRGSGPSGLGTMPVSRGRILRPLIGLSRRDVLDYLAGRCIAWREDSTNTDIQFLRNRIRHRLIPSLNEHFPQWRGAVTAMAETQSLAAKFICKEAACRINWGSGIRDQGLGERKGLGIGDWGSGNRNAFFADVENFFAQPAIIREEALFQGINMLGIPAKIKRKNIRRFAGGEVTAVDLGSLQIRRDSQWVMIVAALEMGTGDWGGGNAALGTGSCYSNYQSITREQYCSPNNDPRSPIPDPRSPEKGFSLLIYAPGSYNLKGIALEVKKDLSSLGGDRGFLAFLPLVLRPYFRGDRLKKGELTSPKGKFPGQILNSAVITAEDSLGPAAFIGINGGSCCLLGRRDDGVLQLPEDGESHRVVRVTINVDGGV